MKHEPFNESTEMYLKTVSELAEDTGAQVPISALAERMGVSNVSATEMIHRLKKQDLLDHQPYKGVSLTPKGQIRATAVIRSHHMWECFLAGELGLSWEQVHDFACRLEHATDTAVTEALAVYLGNPQTCPHGNPIPGPDGIIAFPDDVPLTSLQPGQSATINRIFPESTLLLAYLAGRELKPGQTITFIETAPFNGPLMVTCGAQTHALGHEIAAHLFVKILPGVQENY